jgi:hypothetical protein
MPASRFILLIIAGFILTSVIGCDSLLHNLKPHRLWRLNRHSPPMSTGSSVYYSVPPPPLKDDVAAEPNSANVPEFMSEN